MRLVSLLLIGLFIYSPAFADEAQVACDLIQSQADLTSSLLEYPKGFSFVGNPGITQTAVPNNQQYAVVGLRQSLGGIFQANKIQKASQAECEATRATIELDAFLRWIKSNILYKSAEVEMPYLKQALKLAQQFKAISKQQLLAGLITLNDYQASSSAVHEVGERMRLLQDNLAVKYRPINNENLKDHMLAYVNNFSRSEELKAQSIADSGWDVLLSAGGRQDLKNYSPGSANSSLFGSITFEYSFGFNKSSSAAKSIGLGTYKLSILKETGYVSSIYALKDEFEGLKKSEEVFSSSVKSMLDEDIDLKKSIYSTSNLAYYANAKLDLQIELLKSELAGSMLRRDMYGEISTSIVKTFE